MPPPSGGLNSSVARIWNSSVLRIAAALEGGQFAASREGVPHHASHALVLVGGGSAYCLVFLVGDGDRDPLGGPGAVSRGRLVFVR